MKKLDLTEVTKYVEDNISVFHKKRITSLDKLQLKTVLKKKNPYLFKAKNVRTPETIVRSFMDAFVSSKEETIFGDWLEGLAIFVNQKVYGGRKSIANGIDLEFDKDNVRYIVAIKSGPNWGNSSQIAKMRSDFKSASRTLRTSNSGLQIVSVNGCCYGRDATPDKGDYFKYCGQEFWEFISNDSDLYIKIIEPLGHMAHEQNKEFEDSMNRMLTRFTLEFGKDFCLPDGSIDWEKLLIFNSGRC